MTDFFAYSYDIEFQPFSFNHLIPLALIVIGVLLIFFFRQKLRVSKHEKTIRYSLAILAIVIELSFQGWQLYHSTWDFAESLPLHLCRLTNYLAIFAMLSKNKKVFEIAYFWSLAGVVSIMFPDILHGPDRFRYYHFMSSHILFFYMYMYMLFVLQFELTFKSFKKSVVVLAGLVTLIIIPVNNIFNMNYMYLLEPGDTPFEIFWGNGYFVYLISCISLVGVVMVIWYLPIHFYNRNKKSWIYSAFCLHFI